MNVALSKRMSLLLRHRPDKAGLTLDEHGWAGLSDFAAAMGVSVSEIEEVAATNDKKRFEIVDGRIRASQGHSIEIDLQLPRSTPPPVLFHGTVGRFLEAIRVEGLKPGSRHAVHLSPDIATATRVGARPGKPVTLQIDAAAMGDRVFTVSANGVWLVDHVPPEHLSVLDPAG